ncbi:MAG: hypothetical protein ACYC9O_14790, partial [Candidatus Latescibacterota bacterium]
NLPGRKSKYEPENILNAVKERYSGEPGAPLALAPGASGAPVRVEKDRPVHFLTPPFTGRRGLEAVSFDLTVAGPSGPFPFTAVVQDPLDPRLDLAWVEFEGNGPGRYRLTLDIPDQALLPDTRLWLTLRFGAAVALSGPEGGAPRFGLRFIPVEKALPEAVERRKFLLKTFYALLSEPRPWGYYNLNQPREEFYATNRYSAQCPELFLAIDRCTELAPQDDLVRQYREWVYGRNLTEMPEIAPPPGPPAGVPDWAWHPRQAWFELRRIATWWLDERLVPTGELGGSVGDDSDMYQQYADLPFLEDGGLGARVKESAALLAELADRENLREGINIHATDALHAYEEGINHLALMARWNYGDPIYFERCMDSARNMEKLTVVTPDGRRHFRDYRSMGWRDVETPRTPALDGETAPLMWHTALQVADYNRNPRALGLVGEWADTWLRYQKPGEWATLIEVSSGAVKSAEKNRPLYGGYSTQAVTFAWLAALTGNTKYLEPFLHYYRAGEAPGPAAGFLGDSWAYGFLDGLDGKALDALAERNPSLHLYRTGDPEPLLKAAIGNPRGRNAEIGSLSDAARWPDMYTVTHQFTDRVFPGVMRHASQAYLGGSCLRNRYNPVMAVSWEGFGTDYAALVTANRSDRFRALVYSYSSRSMRGKMRLWALGHGKYRVIIGRDTDGNGKMDRAERSETRELSRADALDLTLPPRAVTVIEIERTEALEPIYIRADLAIAAREVKLTGNSVSGTVHNIGSADVRDIVVAVSDAAGKEITHQSLGALAAPLDLVPKRVAFTIPLPRAAGKGWKIVLDPGNQVTEIYEGNNTVLLEPQMNTDKHR